MLFMGEDHDQEVADAWSCFKDSGSLEARNWLMVHYAPEVKKVALRVRSSLRGIVELDDLMSYGMFGLIDAINKYDPFRITAEGNSVKFSTYASSRIRGQMIDEIRTLDWTPRNVHSRARDLERGREELEATLGRLVSHPELAEHLGLSMVEYWRILDQSQVSIVPLVSEMVTAEFDSFESSWNSAELDHSSNPEDLYEVNQVAVMLSEVVSGMDERLRLILVLYYVQDLTLIEIGEILGVTGGRVCQLQSRALAEIQSVLGGSYAA